MFLFPVLHCHVKKGKGAYSFIVKFTSELRDATCQMGSHSVICYPTEVAAPPSPQPGRLVLMCDIPTSDVHFLRNVLNVSNAAAFYTVAEGFGRYVI